MTTARTPRYLAATVAVLALVVAACGSSNSDEVALEEARTAGVPEACLELAGQWSDVLYPALDTAVEEATAEGRDLKDVPELDALVSETLFDSPEAEDFINAIGDECVSEEGSAESALTSDYLISSINAAVAARTGAEAAAANYLNAMIYCDFDGSSLYEADAAVDLCADSISGLTGFGIELPGLDVGDGETVSP